MPPLIVQPRSEFIPTNKPNRASKFDSREALFRLQKCSTFQHLRQIHALIIRTHHPSLLTHILHRSLSFHQLHHATHVFHQIPTPLTFTWNLIIRAHAFHSPHQSLLLFSLMLSRAASPDKFTFPFVTKACTILNSINSGKQVHALAIKTGFYRDTYFHNTMIDFYGKCGDWECARKVFDKMPVRNVVSWTSLVNGLVSCGELGMAREAFEGMPVRNVVSWTAMINGCVKGGRPEEAFELFRRMVVDNVMPNEFTLVSLLVGCTELGSLKLGGWIHDFGLKNGFKLDAFLGTALIDMYSKCGSVEDAKRVFDSMEEKSVATWNSMITSLGVHGLGREALALFAQMEKAEVVPDAITFVGVLCACVHTGLVEEGCNYFRDMKERYGITPLLEHYSCMVDLFSRAGLLVLDDSHELESFAPQRSSNDIVEAFLSASKEVSVAGLADSVGSDDEDSDSSVSHHQCFNLEADQKI
ncbi:hypothetical protein Scep_020850 [Stephania cephalantha]|uniref:Pentatricopeptide repeat-containing protein n=1 Tax=Stephania cephalantha TaxID=152367 RepID=A0AAP0F3H1_9MAGN